MRHLASFRAARGQAFTGWLAAPWLLILALGLAPAFGSAQIEIPLTVEKGVPLEIKLVNRVPINKPGVPVEGRIVKPVYVYNRPVIPAGCEVLGRVTQVKGISKLARTRAILNGSFTPWRTAKVEFDTLVLKNGKRVPIATDVLPGAAPMVQLVSGGSGGKSDPPSGFLAGERELIASKKRAMLAALRSPHKARWLKEKGKEWISAEIPYHRQWIKPGTIFTAKIENPLNFGSESVPASKLAMVGSPPPAGAIIHARLLTPLDSATTRRGTAVEAAVTEPLFSEQHVLILPQGARLEGTVMDVKPARHLHRNGKLRFTFERIVLPKGQREIVHASVQGAQVARDSHLRLNAEGGFAPAPSKKKYLAPTLSLLLAVDTATPDRDAVAANSTAAVPGQGGAIGKVLAGGWGLGFAGSLVSLASKGRVLTAALGFYGAAWSIYTNLLTRGENVAFPADTSMELLLGSHTRPGHRAVLPGARGKP